MSTLFYVALALIIMIFVEAAIIIPDKMPWNRKKVKKRGKR